MLLANCHAERTAAASRGFLATARLSCILIRARILDQETGGWRRSDNDERRVWGSWRRSELFVIWTRTAGRRLMSYKVDEAVSNKPWTRRRRLNNVRVNEGRRSLNKHAQWCVTDDVFSRPPPPPQQQQQQQCGTYRWRIVERRRLAGLLRWTLRRSYRLPSSQRRRRRCRTVGDCRLLSVVSSPAFQLDAPRETDHSARRFAHRRFYSLLTIYHHTTVCCPRRTVTRWGSCPNIRKTNTKRAVRGEVGGSRQVAFQLFRITFNLFLNFKHLKYHILWTVSLFCNLFSIVCCARWLGVIVF